MGLFSTFNNDGHIIHTTKDNVLLIDLDDTTLHLAPEWIRRYNIKSGKSLTMEDWYHYDFSRCDGFDSDFRDILNEEDIFYNLKAMDGALEAIYDLSEYYTILLCTHAIHGEAAKAKYYWIKNNIKLKPNFAFPKIEDHISTIKFKSLVDGCAIIDDNPLNAIAHKSAKKSYAIGVKHPWNAQYYRQYDLLADSYTDPDKAWEKIKIFLIEALKKGKRYNKKKTPWNLLPSSAIELLFTKANKKQNSSIIKCDRETIVNNLVNHMLLWFNNDSLNNLTLAALWCASLIAFDKGLGENKNYLFVGLSGVAEVMNFGLEKYGERNWEKGLMNEETYSSAMRHIEKIINNEMIDNESTLPHSYHVLWNIIAMIEMICREKHNSNYSNFTKRYSWKE